MAVLKTRTACRPIPESARKRNLRTHLPSAVVRSAHRIKSLVLCQSLSFPRVLSDCTDIPDGGCLLKSLSLAPFMVRFAFRSGVTETDQLASAGGLR